MARGLAGSESLRQSDVSELENHLRDQMEHMKTAGLRDDEAFLVARRRLGDPAALEEEFAKVNPRRRLAERLVWMVTGVLAYLWVSSVNEFVSNASVLLGFSLGLPNMHLTFLAFIMRVATFAGIGMLLWCYFALRATSRTPIKGTRLAILLGVIPACSTAALFHLSIQSNILLVLTMSVESFGHVAIPQGVASLVWATLMPFLAAGLIALLALRNRRNAASA